MEHEKYKQITAEILASLSDPAKVSERLTELTDDYGQVTTRLTAAETEAAALKQKNESLRDTNMRLFLKVGDVPKPSEKPGESEPEQPKLRFEDLYDAKGNLRP